MGHLFFQPSNRISNNINSNLAVYLLLASDQQSCWFSLKTLLFSIWLEACLPADAAEMLATLLVFFQIDWSGNRKDSGR